MLKPRYIPKKEKSKTNFKKISKLGDKMLNINKQEISDLNESKNIKDVLEKKFDIDERINNIIIESYIKDTILTELIIDSQLVKDDFELSKEIVINEFKKYIQETIHPRYTVRSIVYHKDKRKKKSSFIIHIKAKGVFTNYDISESEYGEYKKVFKKYAKKAIFSFAILSAIFNIMVFKFITFFLAIKYLIFFIASFASIFNSIFANIFLYLKYKKDKKMSAKIFGFIFGFISFLISIILIFALFTLIS